MGQTIGSIGNLAASQEQIGAEKTVLNQLHTEAAIEKTNDLRTLIEAMSSQSSHAAGRGVVATEGSPAAILRSDSGLQARNQRIRDAMLKNQVVMSKRRQQGYANAAFVDLAASVASDMFTFGMGGGGGGSTKGPTGGATSPAMSVNSSSGAWTRQLSPGTR